jgi:tripartite-type tricarboxylate transporter receptor subunit TctC
MFVRSASLSAKTDRRRNNLFQLIFAIVVSTGPLGGPVAAAAPACPELAGETITWVVPFGAGGGYDIYSRLIEPHLEAALGAQISVVNVEGAGGVAGTRRISEAAGDGRTLGLVNAAGLAASQLLGEGTVPSLATDLTVIATLTTGDRVWVVRSDGPIASVEDLFRIADQRAIVMPISDVGAATFVSSGVTAALLGIRHEFVAGYSGTNETASALLRDEGDVADFELSSGRANIAAGDLRPLLRPGRSPESDAVLGAEFPALTGEDGLAARRAALQGRDVAQARRQADALSGVSALGRVIVGPRDLDPALATCLQTAVWSVLNDAAVLDALAAAKRPISARDAVSTRQAIEAVVPEIEPLRQILQDEMKRLRS